MNRKAKLLSICLATVLLCACIVGFMVTGADAADVGKDVVWTVDGKGETDTTYETLQLAMEDAYAVSWGSNDTLTIKLATTKTDYNYIYVDDNNTAWGVSTVFRGYRIYDENGYANWEYGNKLPITIESEYVNDDGVPGVALGLSITAEVYTSAGGADRHVQFTNDIHFKNVSLTPASDDNYYYYAGSGEIHIDRDYTASSIRGRYIGCPYSQAAYFDWAPEDIETIKANDPDGLVPSGFEFTGFKTIGATQAVSGKAADADGNPIAVTEENMDKVYFRSAAQGAPEFCPMPYETKAYIIVNNGAAVGAFNVTNTDLSVGLAYGKNDSSAIGAVTGSYAYATRSFEGPSAKNYSKKVVLEYGPNYGHNFDPEKKGKSAKPVTLQYGTEAALSGDLEIIINGYGYAKDILETETSEAPLACNFTALRAAVKGNVSVTINGGKIGTYTYNSVAFTGDVVNTVNGGTFDAFYGTGETVTGNVTNIVSNVDFADNANFYGTGAAVTGDVENIFTSVIADQANELDEDGDVTARPQVIYGTGGAVTGTVTNTIDGTSVITNFYGSTGKKTGKIINNINGGTITWFFSTGAVGSSSSHADLEIVNEFTGEGAVTVTNFYGGGYKGYNDGIVKNNISNPNATFTVYYGGASTSSSGYVYYDVINTISAGTFGSFSASVSNCAATGGNVTNNISGGTFTSTFAGGGNNGKHYTVTNKISGGIFNGSFFGGASSYGGRATTIYNEVTGGTFNGNFVGSGYGSVVGATINEVEVAGSVTNKITGVTIIGDFFGGTSYESSTVTRAAITGAVTNELTGVTVEGTYYGGSFTGNFNGDITNTISGGTFGSFCGGCQENVMIGNITNNVDAATITTFYGGHSNAKAGTATVIVNNITGGTITTFYGCNSNGRNDASETLAAGQALITNNINGTKLGENDYSVVIKNFYGSNKYGTVTGDVKNTFNNVKITGTIYAGAGGGPNYGNTLNGDVENNLSNMYFSDSSGIVYYGGGRCKVNGRVTNNFYGGIVTRNNVNVVMYGGNWDAANGKSSGEPIPNALTGTQLEGETEAIAIVNNFYAPRAGETESVFSVFYGGSSATPTVGSIKTEILGGQFIIFNGGNNTAALDGNVNTTVKGGTIDTFYGTKNDVEATVAADVTNTVSGGTITTYVGAGTMIEGTLTNSITSDATIGDMTLAAAPITGTLVNEFTGMTFDDYVGNPVTITGDVINTLTNVTINNSYKGIGSTAITGSVTNNLNKVTFGEGATFASAGAAIAGNVTNNITGVTFNGDYSGAGVAVTGKVTNTLTDCVITGKYRGCTKLPGSVENTLENVSVLGGTADSFDGAASYYGGTTTSNGKGTTGRTFNVTNTLKGTTSIAYNYFGGSYRNPGYTGTIINNIQDTVTFGEKFFGGNSSYSGGSYGGSQGATIINNISGGTFGDFYGGWYSDNGTLMEGSSVTNNISGGTFTNVYSGNTGTYGSIANNISGGEIGTFCGGGYKSYAMGDIVNTITGGTFKTAYYGGNGFNGSTKTAANIINNIYAGHFSGSCSFNGGAKGATVGYADVAGSGNVTVNIYPNVEGTGVRFDKGTITVARTDKCLGTATLTVKGGGAGAFIIGDSESPLRVFENVDTTEGALKVQMAGDWVKGMTYIQAPKTALFDVDTYSHASYGQGYSYVDGDYSYVGTKAFTPSSVSLGLSEKITMKFYFDAEAVDQLFTGDEGKANYANLTVSYGLLNVNNIFEGKKITSGGKQYYVVEVANVSPLDMNETIVLDNVCISAETTLKKVLDTNINYAGGNTALINLCKAIQALGTTETVEGAPVGQAVPLDGAYAYGAADPVAFKGSNQYGIIMRDAVGFTLYGEFIEGKNFTVKVNGVESAGYQAAESADYGKYFELYVPVGKADEITKIEIIPEGSDVADYTLNASVAQIASIYLAENSTASDEVKTTATEILAYIQAANAYIETLQLKGER